MYFCDRESLGVVVGSEFPGGDGVVEEYGAVHAGNCHALQLQTKKDG